MSNIQLTKDTDKVLCTFYKEYLSRLKNGFSKSSAIIFEDTVISNLFPNDISTELQELKRNNLIDLWITGEFELTSNAISYMENRFKNGLVEVADFIAKFIP